MKTVFATKYWREDWEKIEFGGLTRKMQAIGYPFDNSLVVGNNGSPKTIRLQNHIDTIREEVQEFFNLKDMNNYASGELASIYLAKEYDYLCYVQGDCITTGGDFVTPAIKILESEPNVFVVSPSSDVNTWHNEDGYDHYMSDQAFVIRVKDFLNPKVYAVSGLNPDYPDYGGNSFEAMVGKYLVSSKKTRKILNDFYVVHPAY